MGLLKHLKRQKWILLDRLALRRKTFSSKGLRIIAGAGNTTIDGWISTDYPVFNLLSTSHWRFLYRKNSIDNLLLEHVLEHFTPEDVALFFSNAKPYLNRNGVIRIAVPDKNHPNEDYYERVKPGGTGIGSDDHKSFWDYSTLRNVGESQGYISSPIEYWNKHGKFISNKYSPEYGKIIRRVENAGFDNYTSLIFDFIPA